jgi:hypothetical protein
MTRHASGWFGRLREPCCGYAAEEATVSGAHSGHGQEGPPMSRMIATAAPYRRSDLSAPISVIRSQKQSGSNQPLEPTETSSCRGSIFKGASRVSSCLRGSAQRSIRMTRHASGWFGRLREPCCGYYAAEEATVSGAHSGHGQEGPPMSRMIATAGPYRRSDLSAPISVIRSQKKSGSNQPLEPTETSSCRGSIFKGASRVSRHVSVAQFIVRRRYPFPDPVAS